MFGILWDILVFLVCLGCLIKLLPKYFSNSLASFCFEICFTCPILSGVTKSFPWAQRHWAKTSKTAAIEREKTSDNWSSSHQFGRWRWCRRGAVAWRTSVDEGWSEAFVWVDPSTKTGEAESARETCFVWKVFCKYSGSFLLLVVFLKHRLYMAVVSRGMHITGVSFGLGLAAWRSGLKEHSL